MDRFPLETIKENNEADKTRFHGANSPGRQPCCRVSIAAVAATLHYFPIWLRAVFLGQFGAAVVITRLTSALPVNVVSEDGTGRRTGPCTRADGREW